MNTRDRRGDSYDGVPTMLELDPELVARAAAIHEGYADVYERRRREHEGDESGMLMASCYLLSAVYWSIIDASRAADLFRVASSHYEEMAMPYAVVLAICGKESEATFRLLEERTRLDHSIDTESSEPEAHWHNLLAMLRLASVEGRSSRAREVLPRVLDRGHRFAYTPVGRLSMPAHLYQAIGSAMLGAMVGDDPQMEGMTASLADFLRRADDAVGGAMSDTHHWTRLRSGVLPIEPEVLAVCRSVDAMVRRPADDTAGGRRLPGSVAAMVEDTDLTPRQRVPALVASAMPIR